MSDLPRKLPRRVSRPGWRIWLQLLAGIALVVGVGLLLLWLRRAWEAHRLPTGWRIIRPPHEVSALVVHDGQVWAGGQDGLYCLDRATGALLPLPAGAPKLQHVRALAVDHQGTLWAAHGRGVAFWDGSAWGGLDQDDGLFPGGATALLVDGEGILWIGQEQGLLRFFGGRLEVVALAETLGMGSVDVIYQDHEGALWVGSASPTHGGVAIYRNGEWEIIPRSLLPHPAVNAIMETKEGDIWIGTGFADRGGALRNRQGEWLLWTVETGLAGAKVRSLFQDDRGRLWFGSEYDGLAITDGQTWMYIRPEDGLPNPEVKVICQDAEGAFWLGTADGVLWIQRLEWAPEEWGNRS